MTAVPSVGRLSIAVTALILALLGAALLAPEAGAHALLRHSDPEGGAVLQRAPTAVTLTFTEQPEATLSTIHAFDGSGRPLEQGPPQVVRGQPLELRTLLGPLPEGVYTVSWRTVSRIDGHVTGGAFAFGVGVTPSAALEAKATTPPPSPLSVAAKWGLYAGLSGLLGVAWVWTWVVREPPVWGQQYLWITWILSVAGILSLGADQAATAGVTVGRLLETPLGRALWWRAIPIGAAGIAIGVGQILPLSRRRFVLVLAGVASAGAMLAHVLAGHAGASTGLWRWANIADQWAHFVAVGTWIGGLAALLVALRGAPDAGKAAAARRFSTIAGITLGVVAGTGILRAVDEVGTWSALPSTDFGRLVLVKASLLLTLAALGAVNRFWSVPAAPRTLRPLRRGVRVELVAAGAVLTVTGLLTGLAPPSLTREAAGTASGLVVSGQDFATSVRVRMEIAPGFPGVNRFVARVADYDTGRPIGANRVTLRFARPDRPDMGSSTLDLVRMPDGTYEGRGANLSLDGQWGLTMTIEQAANAVTVPLIVNVRSRPQTVRTIEAPGQPTLYSVELTGGRLLDVYLDPQRPGFNEVHATFIDAAGGELPVPRPAVISAGRPGQPLQGLPVRRFGPGHFIGDAQLAAGDWQIEIAATARDGTGLQARLTVHVR